MSDEGFVFERSPERQQILDALLSDIRRRRDQLRRLDRLCARLGLKIDGDESERLANEWDTWARVGMALAAEQPEFGRGRGRPRLPDPSAGKDVLRAQAVVELATNHSEFNCPPKSLNWWLSFIREHTGELPATSHAKRYFGQAIRTVRESTKRGLKEIKHPPDLFAEK